MLLAGLFAFIRHPNVFVSNSADVCDCLDEPHIGQWLSPYCANATAAHSEDNSTSNNQSTVDQVSWEPTNSTFDQVDAVTVLMALVTGLAMVFMIWLAVMFARYRRPVANETKQLCPGLV